MLKSKSPKSMEFISLDISGALVTVKLTSSVTFEGVAYNNDDLIAFAKTLLQKDSDDELEVSEKDIENSLKNITIDEDTITAALSIKARLVPVIDQKALRKTLAGKSFEEVRKTLKEYPQVDDVTITLFPPIPFLPAVMPRIAENITIDLQTK